LYADAVGRSSPSVVNIYTARIVAQRTRPSELDRLYGDRWPAVQRRVQASLGSGVIVDAQGHIVTNNHVVEDATGIKIQLADGRIAEEVTIVGRDPETDLAVLRVKLDKLPTMPLGRSDKVRVGDVVLAIGNPYGLSQTVTQGIVSATGRDQLGLSDIAVFESYIQTDAAINLGNSGGALVNADGELIGINAAVLGQSAGVEGIGFAIPVNLVRGVVEQILKFGHVRRGWLGVNGQSVTPEHAKRLGLPNGVGVVLLEVYTGSPAAKAGLQPGDVLTALNGLPVHTDLEARNRVAALAPGRNLRIEARRGAEKIDVRVKVEERQTDVASKN
jgi:Do/DeqQ family serine protease